MISLQHLSDKPIAVFGLGRSGLASARALMESGARLWAWDDKKDARAKAQDAGIPLVDLYHCNWEEPDFLVLSPGIPLHFPTPHPLVTQAREKGCEIIGDIELIAQAVKSASCVGITGTNGKSTATALVGHILASAGRKVEVGGNIGTPVLELHPLGAGGSYVLEVSSYQLELTPSAPFDVAVLLNIAPDHLERHGSMDNYLAAKKLIFSGTNDPATAIIGTDDSFSKTIFEEVKKRDRWQAIAISGNHEISGGVYVLDGVLVDDRFGKNSKVLDLASVPSLPGAHNWQNAAAAFVTASVLGLGSDEIAAGLETYKGLAHRQERIGVANGVLYVNDSKATNASAAAKALSCYDTIYWIAGGRTKDAAEQDKSCGFEELEPFLGRIRHAFLIGEAAERFAELLGSSVPLTKSETLDRAVAEAARTAEKERLEGASVLLSPACASFDQFDNFEARGEAFRSLVKALPGFKAVEGGLR
jgi:UDP-N-acetylmuramoylalanine--D-glutamate ligase